MLGVMCVLLSLGMYPSSLFAQDSAEEELLFYELEHLLNVSNITVASNVVTAKERQPVSITTISHRQLELSGARTLSEAIMMYVPGFFLVEDQDDIIAGFRGLAPDNNSKVMLLMNGHYLNTEWFWGPPDAILNTINYEWIDHVQVIRGPGSVTLGQGALLGVINIVTKSGSASQNMAQSAITGSGGLDRLALGALETSIQTDALSSYFYLSSSRYDGQELREEGWALNKTNEGITGGTVADIGTRLKRTDNTTAFGAIESGQLKLNLLYVDQQKDLYNFYRDRNRTREVLTMLGLEHHYSFSEHITLRTRALLARDDFFLSSVMGLTAGGTRENRYGITSILNLNHLFEHHQLAIGAEYRRFEFGQENINGDNFIINVLNEATLEALPQANVQRTWGYPDEIDVLSLVVEDFYQMAPQLDIFGAFRYDQHPFWGSHLSPRLGVLYVPTDDLRLRFSWQTGFRGAAGVHYGGGYRNDGLLSGENFDQIHAAQIPIYDANGNPTGAYEPDQTETEPESMSSFELAANYKPAPNVVLDAVGFYNVIENVIDVGVIWRDPEVFPMVTIGSDVPGDWNGYWFFKNNDGKIKQYGVEASLTYTQEKYSLNLSHALVKISDAPDQQRASMYLTNDLNFKAFPENVTRLNVIATPTPQSTIAMNYLYYYQWYSPRDQAVDGNHIVNVGAIYEFTPQIDVSVNIKNLLNQDNLYPMNSNAEGPDLSDGTPALEETSFWARFRYHF